MYSVFNIVNARNIHNENSAIDSIYVVISYVIEFLVRSDKIIIIEEVLLHRHAYSKILFRIKKNDNNEKLE